MAARSRKLLPRFQFQCRALIAIANDDGQDVEIIFHLGQLKWISHWLKCANEWMMYNIYLRIQELSMQDLYSFVGGLLIAFVKG